MHIIQAQLEAGVVVICGVTFKIKDGRYPLSAIPLLIFQEIANTSRIGEIEQCDFAGRTSRTCKLYPDKVGFQGVIHCRSFAEISELHLYEGAEMETMILEITAGVPAQGGAWKPSGGDYSREQIQVESQVGKMSPVADLVSEIIEGIAEIGKARCFYQSN